jgi:hypothetical protein
MQGTIHCPAVIGWQSMVDTTLGQVQREALRQVKELQELLRHVGKYGERHDDGFVAPITACLYDHDHEGVLEDADCSSAAAHSCNSQSSRGRGFATAAGCLTGGRIEKVKVPHGRLGSSRR